MKHFFDVEIAKQLGINSAILLENLYFWIKKNEANKKHHYDGKYWTYNSVEAFTKLFPYFTYDSIRYSLEKLEKAGYIITGNYNQMPMDKTKWYALTEKAYSLIENSQMDLGFFPDGKGNNPIAIPDNKTDKEKKESKKEPSYDEIINTQLENEALRETFREFMQKGLMGMPAKMSDWLTHISLFFPDVRLKSYVEIRNHLLYNRLECFLKEFFV